MVTAIALTLLAGFCRFLSADFGLWNFVPMGAMALYAGSRLPRRWAWLVPVAAMGLSDLLLDFGTGRPLFEPSRWMIYATFAATTLLGPISNRARSGPWLLPVLSLSASLLFFLASNLGVWIEGRMYPMTVAGLAECYTLALPFFRSTVIADLLGTCVLFGPVTLIERAAQRWTHPQLEAEAVRID